MNCRLVAQSFVPVLVAGLLLAGGALAQATGGQVPAPLLTPPGQPVPGAGQNGAQNGGAGGAGQNAAPGAALGTPGGLQQGVPLSQQNPLTPDQYQRVMGSAVATSGDQLQLTVSPTVTYTISLWGIDAPEMEQLCRSKRGAEYPCGEWAKNALTHVIQGRQVMCALQYTNSREDTVGRCQQANIDISAAMVAYGWAFSSPYVTSNYDQIQTDAQAHQRGMWAGRVEPPWNFRSRRHANASADPGPPSVAYDYGQ
ncbi:thermonuclease family protein [Radicibacter daui]|uniref:thermonuclease family protein n=1 Tax=Radicibacter daui TaxID=3064829 RepID=UPI004046F9DC